MAAGPSVSLLLAAIGAAAVGALLPATPVTRHRNPAYRLLRRAARFTTADSLPSVRSR
jgi:hypothetical protein